MGKRSDFERIERDFYKTPIAAVRPLVPFLPDQRFTFAEPCAGDGRLAQHIYDATYSNSQCRYMCDIEPQNIGIKRKDALQITKDDLRDAQMIITNPPWDRTKKSGYLLHQMIRTFSNLAPTWLLFDSDWMQTVQAKPYLDRLVCTVSIGRVKWIEGSTMTGKDNCQWHLFHSHARLINRAPEFFGRGELPYEGFIEAYLDTLTSDEDMPE